MKTTDHLIGDRVSVRCRTAASSSWLGGTIIMREARPDLTRFVVQLDDNRRVVALDDDIRRWSLSFEVVDMLERMAS